MDQEHSKKNVTFRGWVYLHNLSSAFVGYRTRGQFILLFFFFNSGVHWWQPAD
jgi:hypothetical protein